jgi:hypothetical protein
MRLFTFVMAGLDPAIHRKEWPFDAQPRAGWVAGSGAGHDDF